MIPTEYHEIASKLLGTSEIPVDINRVLTSFTDIQLEYIGQITTDTPLVGKDGDTYIFITVENPTREERFTIAKNLAHLLLGHIDNYSKLYHRQANELQLSTNRLAMALLVPVEHLSKQILESSVDGIVDMTVLADIYDVPVTALTTYAKELKLIERN
jgi:hypothetical protein